jgi:alpha-tubulin suppressor-like RCC1 family protein
MRAVLCALVLVSGCTEQLSVLDRGSSTSSSSRCMCGDDELCAVDQCINKFDHVHLSAGYRHTCRVKDAILECWGENRAGQLGLGDPDERPSPTQVGDGSSWLEVSAAEEHTCAIASPGRLYCWGNNRSGQLGIGNNASRNVPTRVGSSFDDFEHVFTGGDSTCALRNGGALYCWGASGTLIAGTGDVSTPQIADEPIEVLPDVNVREVSLGASHTCAVRGDGLLSCWGQNGDGQLGIGMVSEMAKQPVEVPGTGWQHVAAGQHHTCGIRDGGLYCWGRAESYELGLMNNRRMLTPTPTRVENDRQWSAVAVGSMHSCAITVSKRLFCWGRNGEGQIGMTPSAAVQFPTMVGTNSNTRYGAISLGTTHSCALDTGQVLYCWGGNDQGQLGLGDAPTPHSMPTAVD